MKSKLIVGYLLISVLFASWGYFFGATQHMSYAYNLGRGLTWPVIIIKGEPEVNGESDQAFYSSLQEMKSSYPQKASHVDAAIGAVLVLIHAEQTPDFNGDQIKALFKDGSNIPPHMFSDLMQVRGLINQLKERLDGMDIDDVLNEAEDAKEALLELAEERPAPVEPEPVVAEGEACYDEKLAAFREAAGEDAPAHWAMQQEWRSECGLPLEE
ncbi:hypothetical protein WG219_02250 [Ectopseudomonas mendocina]|uniref:Uncharacterized protein n=1 Tax=Ectopseudomonas mendocina TaxID=300 RepID=A0ABZ2RL49_ECTME